MLSLVWISGLFSACVEVASEDQAIDREALGPQVEDGNATLPMIRRGSLAARYLLYKPTILPLEGFVRKLGNGDLTAAFSSVDLFYQTATSDSIAVRQLLRAGFIPVLVNLSNSGSAQRRVSEGLFRLINGPQILQPIPVQDVPHELVQFIPEVAAADAYNSVVGVLGFFTALVVAPGVLDFKHGGSANATNLLAKMGNYLGHNGDPWLKSPLRTTTIDYRDYLVTDTVLRAGETINGLIFFKAAAEPDWQGLRLSL